MIRAARLLVGIALTLTVSGSAGAQYVDTFDHLELDQGRSGVDGWSCFSGDGEATASFTTEDEGLASIVVDATRDQKNIWWALIKRKVSDELDLERLARPGLELRIEARIRTSHGHPRGVLYQSSVLKGDAGSPSALNRFAFSGLSAQA